MLRVTLRSPHPLVWIGALAAAVLTTVAFATLSVPYVSCLLVTLLVVAAMAIRRESLLAPTGPLLLFTVTSATLPALLGYFDSTPLVGIDYADYSRAGVALLVFVACALAGYLLWTRGEGSVAPATADRSEPLALRRLWLLWAGLSLVALLAVAVGVGSAGGLHGYLDGLASRRVFFSGRAWILLALIAPAPAALTLVAAGFRMPLRTHLRTNAALAGAALGSFGFLFLTGNRMNLVVYAASLTVVFDRRVRRIGIVPLIAGVLVAVLLGQAFLGIVRPASDSERGLRLPSPAAVYASIDETGPVGDFRHVPALAMILSDRATLEREHGATYLSAATILLPSAVAPWKLPVAGELATRQLLPRVWAGGTSIQVTAPGEAYLNFGWVGIPALGLAFGLLLVGLRHLYRHGTLAATLVYAIALPRVALLMRGDFGNVMGYFLLELGVVLAALLIVSGSPAWLGGWMRRRMRVS